LIHRDAGCCLVTSGSSTAKAAKLRRVVVMDEEIVASGLVNEGVEESFQGLNGVKKRLCPV